MNQVAGASLDRMRSFLEKDQDNLRLRQDFVDQLMASGQMQEAEQVLRAGLEMAPADPKLRFQLATVDLAVGRARQAADGFTALLADGINASAIRYNQAYALWCCSDFMPALEAVEAVPVADVPQAGLLKTRLLHHTGKLEEAAACGEEYAANHPGDREIGGVLALLYLDMNQADKALHWSEAALEKNPEDHSAKITAGVLALGDKKIEDAETHFNDILAKHPNSGRAWLGLGLLSMLRKDMEKAEGYLHKAIEFMPNHLGTRHALAWSCLVQRRLEEAESIFDACNEIDRNFGETHGGLAVVYALQGRMEEAETSVKRAMKLDPGSVSGQFAKAALVSAAGDKAKSEQLMQGIMSAFESQGVDLVDWIKRFA